MASLLSSFNFFASGTGIIITCAVAAAMILLWDRRFSLIGLVIVQFGVAAVALQTGKIEAKFMIVQVCIIALCTLILALSIAQAPHSPTIYQPGNWVMRLLMLILVYSALRLFDFNFNLPFPDGIEASEALRMTVFFIWLSICALLTLGLSDNPLFTGIALLMWCVPAHVFATLLTPESGVSVLIGIMELLLALGCSYLILTESFSIKQRPVVATDITFPLEGRRMLTDNSMVPIGEMTTMDIPAVPMTAEARQAMMGKTLPQTAPRGTVISDTTPTGTDPRVNQTQTNLPQTNQGQTNRDQTNRDQTNRDQTNRDQTNRDQGEQQHANQIPRNQPQVNQKRVRSGTPLTRTNLRAVQKPLPKPSQPTQMNQLSEELQEPTRPTPNLFSTANHAEYLRSSGNTLPTSDTPPKPPTDNAIEAPNQQEKSEKEATGLSRLFKRTRNDEPDPPEDKPDTQE